MRSGRKCAAFVLAFVMVLGLAEPSSAASYTVVRGDTLGRIGNRFGVSWQTIAEENGISDVTKLMPGTVLKIGGLTKNGTVYQAVRGDTLGSIGKELEISWQELAAANGITDPRRLMAGQLLVLPGHSQPAVQEIPEVQEPAAEALVEEPEERPVAEPEPEQKAEAYTESEISIKNGTYDIPAVVTMPEGAGPFPAVVMLHGTGSDKDEAGGAYAYAAPLLAEAGIVTVRIDFAGSGASQEDYINYSYTAAVSDASAAAAYAANLEQVNSAQIGVLGWSQGGTIAMLAAAENNVFQSVVTWAGATDLSGIYTEEGHKLAQEQGYTLLEFDWRDSLKLGLKWYDDVKSTDVLAEFAKSSAPVLAVNGLADDVVLPENADKIKAASTNSASKTLLIENCDHTFNVFSGDMTALDTAVQATADFFRQTLGQVSGVEQTVVTFAEYMALTEEEFFRTGKLAYTIEGMMVSKDTELTNTLEGADYTAKPNGEDVVLKGQTEEVWVTSLENVTATYTKEDGSELTAADFKPDEYIKLTTKTGFDNYACYIPLEYQVLVDSSWGELLYANRPGVDHGDGDFLICRAGEDGEPDFTDVWVFNGAVFYDNYDVTYQKK